MARSKAWDWKHTNPAIWMTPEEDIVVLADRWESQQKKSVLDLGCGIGRHVSYLRDRGFNVAAFDLSYDALKTITEREGPKIHPVCGDMLHLPYQPGSFDAILAFHAIYHTDEDGLKIILNQIWSILKADGEAFLTFLSQKDPAYRKKGLKNISRNVRIKTEPPEKGVPHIFLTEPEVRSLVKPFHIVDFYQKEEICDGSAHCHYLVLLTKSALFLDLF